MAFERKISVSRLLDIVAGSKVEAAKNEAKLTIAKKLSSIVNKEESLRKELTSALPNFYLIDLELVAKESIAGLFSSNKYISSILEDSASGAAFFSSDNEFNKLLPVAKKKLEDNLPLLVKKLHSSLTQGVNGTTDNYTKLNTVNSKALFKNINSIYDKAVAKIALAEFKNLSYISYRNAAAGMAGSLRQYLTSLGVVLLEDAASVVSLPNNNTLVVVASNFDNSIKTVNARLQAALEDFILLVGNIVVNNDKLGYKVGYFINSGHTAAYYGNGELVGINMPSAQITQFRASGNSSVIQNIEKNLGNLKVNTEYGLKFKENFNAQAGMLLDMQFSFTATMPAFTNTQDHNRAEQAAIKSAIEQIVLKELKDVALSKGASNLEFVAVNEALNTAASPTYIEVIVESILDILKGKKPKTQKKTVVTKDSKKLTVGSGNKSNQNKNIQQKSKPVNIKVKIKNQNFSGPSPAINLLNLQDLLNSKLRQQIQDNMGTGNSRRVLNYRTGRLADSAKVERLSISREGMITAFYSYMKNPYATFSQGGKQQNPKTRDPKLLISKSIRDLGAQIVTSRMRAVNV